MLQLANDIHKNLVQWKAWFLATLRVIGRFLGLLRNRAAI